MRQTHLPEWSLGDRLTKARHDAGLKQADMADILGVTRAAVSGWERGEHQPRDLLDLVARWSDATGVPRAWLLGEDPKSVRLVEPVDGQMELGFPVPRVFSVA